MPADAQKHGHDGDALYLYGDQVRGDTGEVGFGEFQKGTAHTTLWADFEHALSDAVNGFAPGGVA